MLLVLLIIWVWSLPIQIPSKLLIQVPRYGKKFQTFQKTIPDIQLDIAEVTDSVYTGICLESRISETISEHQKTVCFSF